MKHLHSLFFLTFYYCGINLAWAVKLRSLLFSMEFLLSAINDGLVEAFSQPLNGWQLLDPSTQSIFHQFHYYKRYT